jgi:hypothetical protein
MWVTKIILVLWELNFQTCEAKEGLKLVLMLKFASRGRAAKRN